MDSKDSGDVFPSQRISKRKIYLSILWHLFSAGLLSSFIVGALLIPALVGWGCISGDCQVHSFLDLLDTLVRVPLASLMAAAGFVFFFFPSIFIGGFVCLCLKRAGVFNFYTLFIAGCLIATLNGLAFWRILMGGDNIVASGISAVGGAVTAALAYTKLKKIDQPEG